VTAPSSVSNSTLAPRLQALELQRVFALVGLAGWRLTVMHAGVLLVQACLPLLSLWTTRHLFDALAVLCVTRDGREVFPAFVGWVSIAAAVALVMRWFGVVTELIAETHGMRLADRCADRVQRHAGNLDLAQIERPDVQDMLHRASGEVAQRPARVLRHLVRLVQGSLTVAVMAAVLVTLHWSLPLGLALLVIPSAFTRRRAVRAYDGYGERTAAAGRELSYLGGLLTTRAAGKDVRVLDLAPEFAARASGLRARLRDEWLWMRRRHSAASAAASSLALLGTFACFVWLGLRALAGQLTVGAAVMFAQALQQFEGAVQNALGGWLGLGEERVFLARLHAFLDLRPRVVAPASPQDVPARGASALRLHGVGYTYAHARAPALVDIDLTIAPGEHIALVGRNGAGKSTLVRLLCRLDDPQHGQIIYGGVDLRAFDPAAWRARVAVLFQDAAPFDLPAADNITAGRLGDPRVAARLVGLDERLSALPHGYDTRLGLRFAGGIELSGGEWRRLLLARVLHRDADVVIFDEPGAFLDPVAERALWARLHDALRGRTVVLVGHHPATVQWAHRVVVLDRGRVVEQGTHDELRARSALYRELFGAEAEARTRLDSIPAPNS
jgi:ATP-binding cassette subfamily B protein